MKTARKSRGALVADSRDELISDLRRRLQEAEEALDAIRRGEVDALVISDGQGERVFTLQGAEQPYRAMIERMSEGAAVLTKEGVILYCNGRFAEILDERLESIFGANSLPFIAPADRRRFSARLGRALRQIERGDLHFQCRNGRMVPVQLALSPLEFEGGQSICMVATDYREKEARLRLALDAGRMGLLAWDFQRRRVLFDRTQCELFGINSVEAELSPEEVMARMVPEDCKLMQQQIARIVKDGGDFGIEFRVLLPDDRVRWLALRGRVIRGAVKGGE